jgi:hypothetical protein
MNYVIAGEKLESEKGRRHREVPRRAPHATFADALSATLRRGDKEIVSARAILLLENFEETAPPGRSRVAELRAINAGW